MQEDSSCDFTRTRPENLRVPLNRKSPPLLRKRPGFRDELVLINLTAQQAEAISLWNSQESADTFGKGSSDMLKVLGKFTKDKPQVQRFQVAKTTLPRQMEGSTV